MSLSAFFGVWTENVGRKPFSKAAKSNLQLSGKPSHFRDFLACVFERGKLEKDERKGMCALRLHVKIVFMMLGSILARVGTKEVSFVASAKDACSCIYLSTLNSLAASSFSVFLE